MESSKTPFIEKCPACGEFKPGGATCSGCGARGQIAEAVGSSSRVGLLAGWRKPALVVLVLIGFLTALKFGVIHFLALVVLIAWTLFIQFAHSLM